MRLRCDQDQILLLYRNRCKFVFFRWLRAEYKIIFSCSQTIQKILCDTCMKSKLDVLSRVRFQETGSQTGNVFDSKRPEIPMRIRPSPRAFLWSVVIPSSRVDSVCSAQERNSSPNRVRVVFLPFFSNSGIPSSFSSCAIAWLRLGCEMQSCSSAFVLF